MTMTMTMISEQAKTFLTSVYFLAKTCNFRDFTKQRLYGEFGDCIEELLNHKFIEEREGHGYKITRDGANLCVEHWGDVDLPELAKRIPDLP